MVGLGRIGSLLEDDRLREKPCTHAGAITENDSCVLVGGCDIREDRCKLFAERWGCEVYTDVDETLDKTVSDIVCVATPPETHLQIVKKALHHGVLLVICEKPLADNSGQAFEIAEMHRSGLLKIITNHERRYSRDYIRARKMIQQKKFGSLLSISSKIYMGKSRPVFDILLEDGTHLIDTLQFLANVQMKVEHTALHEGKNEESLFINGSLGDIPVFTEIASGRDHVVFEIDMSFASGRIRIGNGLYEEYISETSPFYEGFRSLRRGPVRRPHITGYFRNMLNDAVRCVRDPAGKPVSSAQDGYTAVRLIETVKGMVAE